MHAVHAPSRLILTILPPPAPIQLIYALHASLSNITKSSPSLEERFAIHKAASKKIKDAMEEIGLGFIPLSREASANGMSAVKFPEGIAATECVSSSVASRSSTNFWFLTHFRPFFTQPSPQAPREGRRHGGRAPQGRQGYLFVSLSFPLSPFPGLSFPHPSTHFFPSVLVPFSLPDFRIGHMGPSFPPPPFPCPPLLFAHTLSLTPAGVSVTDSSRGDVDKIIDTIKESLKEAGYKHNGV